MTSPSVVGPEFGPLAAFCVGLVQRRAGLIRRSALSLAVGFPVGMAGMLSLTSAKAGTLVGVLISVTTIPAAANAAVAVAYGVRDEALGSALQLVINVASIVVAGVLTLLVQRLVWWRPDRAARQPRRSRRR